MTLPAEVDRAHERLSGPATQRIPRREHEEYGKAEYARLAGISVSAASRPPNPDLFQDHLVLETLTRFRIIRGLENP